MEQNNIPLSSSPNHRRDKSRTGSGSDTVRSSTSAPSLNNVKEIKKEKKEKSGSINKGIPSSPKSGDTPQFVNLSASASNSSAPISTSQGLVTKERTFSLGNVNAPLNTISPRSKDSAANSSPPNISGIKTANSFGKQDEDSGNPISLPIYNSKSLPLNIKKDKYSKSITGKNSYDPTDDVKYYNQGVNQSDVDNTTPMEGSLPLESTMNDDEESNSDSEDEKLVFLPVTTSLSTGSISKNSISAKDRLKLEKERFKSVEEKLRKEEDLLIKKAKEEKKASKETIKKRKRTIQT